jgi:uncharacterized RDD family membrane protein YckC
MTAQPPEPPSEQPAPEGSAPPPPPPAYSSAPPPAEPSTPYGAPTYGSYGAAPDPGAYPASGAGQPGSLLDRFLARLIDGILLAIVNGVLVGAVIVGAVMGESGGFMMGTGSSYAVAAVSALVGVAIQMGYFVFMESSRGQTVGKMIMKLRTQGPGGGNPTVEEAIRRNIFMAIGLLGLVPVLGLFSGLVSLAAVIAIAITINNDAVNRQGWHDNFAGGTRVVKIG